MAKDLRRKLQQLGVLKGVRHLNTSDGKRPLIVPPLLPTQNQQTTDILYNDEDEPIALEELFPNGRLDTNSHGTCFVVDHVYPHRYQHGRFILADLLKQDFSTVKQIDLASSWDAVNADQILFIDTETTGLRGAGTIPFMIGVAFIDQDHVTVRQFFLRDHGDESAALQFLAQLIEERPALVTFNGRSFDLPLLDGRLFMNRIELPSGELSESPHFDLLHPARRLWRERYASCSLNALEQNVLGVHRTQQDVPSHIIPFIYNDYLHNGSLHRLQHVFYHNHIDMLSMVTLMAHLLKIINRPTESEHPLELLGLAKWYIKQKRFDDAEQLFYLALSHSPTELDRIPLLQCLSGLLKKMNRRAEARPFWEYLAEKNQDISAYIDLAKFYEWHQIDLDLAWQWTETAVKIAKINEPYDFQLQQILNHRLTRLQQKRLNSDSP